MSAAMLAQLIPAVSLGRVLLIILIVVAVLAAIAIGVRLLRNL